MKHPTQILKENFIDKTTHLPKTDTFNNVVDGICF